MVEIVGAVASATQLGVMALNLLGLLTKIKGGSSTLKRYQQQLLELRSLSYSISHNPLLQTAEVDYLTRSILSNISQNDLEQKLHRGWLSRTCTFIYRERELLELFDTLDRQKTSLSLVIEHIQAHAIHSIQLDIRTMVDRPRRHDLPSPPESDTEESYKIERLSSGNKQYMDPANMKEPSAKYQAGDHEKGGQPTIASRALGHDSTQNQSSQTSTMGGFFPPTTAEEIWALVRSVPKDLKGNHYINNVAANGTGQHIGALFHGPLAEIIDTEEEINSIPDVFVLNRSIGRGPQEIGDHIHVFDDYEHPAGTKLKIKLPPRKAYYAYNLADSKEGDGTEPVQHIGPSIKQVPKPKSK